LLDLGILRTNLPIQALEGSSDFLDGKILAKLGLGDQQYLLRFELLRRWSRQSVPKVLSKSRLLRGRPGISWQCKICG
jgi:hypothetical protein